MLTKAVDWSHEQEIVTHEIFFIVLSSFYYDFCKLDGFFKLMNQPDEENNSPRSLSRTEIPSLRDSEDIEGSEEGTFRNLVFLEKIFF